MAEFKVNHFHYTWNLPDFFESMKYNSEFRSPKIHVSATDHLTFCVTLQRDHAFQIVVQKNEDLELVLTSCEISSAHAIFVQELLQEDLLGWTVRWRSPKKDIPTGGVKMVVHLFLKESMCTVESNPDISLAKLAKDFSSLWMSEKYSDLTLVVGREEFKVHKAVLAVRAPELVDMLELTAASSLKEVPCIRPPVLRALLRYFYTGKFDIHETGAPLGLSDTLCELKLDALQGMLYAYPNAVSVLTRLATTSHGFVWPVPNFADLPPDQEFASPVVHPAKKCELQLRLRKDVDGEIQVSLAAGDSGCLLHLDVAVEDVFGERVSVTSLDVEVGDWVPTVNVRDLPDDDTLRLVCRVTLRKVESDITRSDASATSLSNCCSSVRDLAGLSADLLQLRRLPRFSDLGVQAGDRRFQVHKAVLAARAPGLLEAINGARNGTMDIDASVLENLLDYIYSGNAVQTDCASATKLYLTAYKYDISPLKVKCLSFIKSNLTF